MSVFLAKQPKAAAFVPTVRDEAAIEAERAALRAQIPDKENLELTLAIYETIKSIRDPEHPYTLEQLNIINMMEIEVTDKGKKKYVTVHWSSPFPTCAYATHIGLAIMLKIQREIMGWGHLKLVLILKPGSHKQKKIIDKQLNDKERICAAQENEDLMGLLESLIS